MVGPDAHPDVKRMALEAADKANINQVYPAGAGRQQWDVFINVYRIRQILWIRDNPTKVTGGTQRQPAAAATTVGGYEVGCPKHMRGWECTNQTFEVAAGGTACADGSHNPNSTYETSRNVTFPMPLRPAVKARAKAEAKARAKARGCLLYTSDAADE